MAEQARFNQLLEAIEALPPDEQDDLVTVIRRRLAERGRAQIVNDVRRGRKEFAEGKCTTSSVDDLLRQIES